MRFPGLLALLFVFPWTHSAPLWAQGKIVEVIGEHPLVKAPFGLDFLPNGDAVFADFGSHRILRIDGQGRLSLIAGSGIKGDEDGIGEKAQFNAPHNVCVDPEGMVYVSDTLNHRVRKVDPATGKVTTLTGSTKGFSGDGGPAEKAQFNEAYHVAMDGPTGLIVVDLMNKRIRRIDLKSLTIKTVAGSGKKAPYEEGAKALESNLVDPRAAAMGPDGSLWILERGGNCLRRVDPATGKVVTVVGTGKTGPVINGPALSATLKGPKYLWTDSKDKAVLFADSANNAIRLLDPSYQNVKTIAGTGKSGKGKPGQDPLVTELKHPHGVAMDSQGRIWISDSENGRILRIER